MDIINEIVAKLRLIVGRCIITAVRQDKGGELADIELLAGEVRRNVEFLQQFGFSSRPDGDVSGLALFVGGSRENGVVVGSKGNASNMNIDLAPGEVAVHSPFGSSIVLKKDGSIDLVAGNKILNFDGELKVTGDVTANVNILPISLVKHKHGTGVGPSSPSIPG